MEGASPLQIKSYRDFEMIDPMRWGRGLPRSPDRDIPAHRRAATRSHGLLPQPLQKALRQIQLPGRKAPQQRRRRLPARPLGVRRAHEKGVRRGIRRGGQAHDDLRGRDRNGALNVGQIGDADLRQLAELLLRQPPRPSALCDPLHDQSVIQFYS